ncbi:M15 family metallopeptidase [soil metagenome]
MKNKCAAIILLSIAAGLSLVTFACSKTGYIYPEKTNTTLNTPEQKKIVNTNSPENMIRMQKAYPDFITSTDENYIYLADGSKMKWDDGKKKTFDELLDNPDPEDMMSIKYPEGKDWDSPPAKDFDPGRIRNEAFLKKMYGSSESEIRKNCVSIDWFGTPVLVTKINGVDQKLKEVMKDLQKLPAEFTKYYNRTGGTFYWRTIKNTDRLSAHSFAAAIDINTEYSDYWEWSKDLRYKNRIPIEIVEVFEKHGFIWGGKWYHYDTMHFEYRPELLQN